MNTFCNHRKVYTSVAHKGLFAILLLQFLFLNTAKAQVGEYRHVWVFGVSGGWAMNKVDFIPEISQGMHMGHTFGIVGRYTSEKYFSTICSIQMEVNIAKLGWKQNIQTLSGEQVLNPGTGLKEEFKRDVTYVQIPIMAHLAWGKERRGVNGFINAGPQIGFYTKDNITKNYEKPFIQDNFPDYTGGSPRSNTEVEQETMAIENKFDYGITFGAGIEWDIKYIGRLSFEGRYYYGLGNMFKDSKTDEFGKSSNGTIYLKFSYLRDF